VNPDIRKIIIATDFSDDAANATDYGFHLAKRLGAKVLLLHVVPLGTYVTAATSAPLPAEAIDAIAAAARTNLSEQSKKLSKSTGVASEVLVVDGPPPATIADLAKAQSADLVVMGTRGKTGLKHVLLGSVAEHVVRNSPVPVLVVPLLPRSS
jgi:nucleotide-binding universal stress UspA family protein